MPTVCQRPVSPATPQPGGEERPCRRPGRCGPTRCPAAIGRKRFVGWRRSASTSSESFQKYTPLAARQNDTNASTAWPSSGQLSSTPAAPGAAKTSRFFVHWSGRAVRSSAAPSDRGAVRRTGDGTPPSTATSSLITPSSSPPAASARHRARSVVGVAKHGVVAGRVAVRPELDPVAAAVAGREPLVQPTHLLVTSTVSPIQLAGTARSRRRPRARCTTPGIDPEPVTERTQVCPERRRHQHDVVPAGLVATEHGQRLGPDPRAGDPLGEPLAVLVDLGRPSVRRTRPPTRSPSPRPGPGGASAGTSRGDSRRRPKPGRATCR